MAGKGRPQGSSDKPFRDILKAVLAENDYRRLRKLVHQVYNKALKGDMTAVSVILDRAEGKVPTSIGGTDELPAIQTRDVTADAARRVLDAMHAAGIAVSADTPKPVESVDAVDSPMESMGSTPSVRED